MKIQFDRKSELDEDPLANRWHLGRLGGGSLNLIRHGLAAAGASLTAMANGSPVIDRREDGDELPPYPAPGDEIPLESGAIHVLADGDRGRSPTVVLEGGAYGVSSTWAWVRAEVATHTRVVSYDRAGLAWSDPRPDPRDGVTIARELRRLLESANEQGPFVLVGYSLGGLFVRIFADLFPEDVAGMVLLDGAHPDQFHFAGGFVRTALTAIAPVFARSGISRPAGSFSELTEGLPIRQRYEAEKMLAWHRHLRGARAELDALHRTVRQVKKTQTLGDTPLLVLGADEGRTGDNPLWYILQRDLKLLSSRSVLERVPGASHTSLLTHREHAALVGEAILEVVRASERRR